jgi:hypothetical protein
MRTLLVLLACCFAHVGFGQIIGSAAPNATFLQTMQGQPITQKNATIYTDGTPFYSNNWLRATIITTDGQAHKDISVRMNLLEGNLHYKDATGMELVNVSPIKEVILTDVDGRPITFVHSSSIPTTELGNTWLQQLSQQGPVRIFKHIKKEVKEMKAYGSATVEMFVTDEKKYYLLSDNNLQKVKKLKDITDVLSAKGSELSRYIREQSLKDKAESDMGRLVDYYNSLSKQ